MKARLGVTICDKCHQPMTRGEHVVIVVQGNITQSGEVLTFNGSCVHFAYHFDCWGSVKKTK